MPDQREKRRLADCVKFKGVMYTELDKLADALGMPYSTASKVLSHGRTWADLVVYSGALGTFEADKNRRGVWVYTCANVKERNWLTAAQILSAVETL